MQIWRHEYSDNFDFITLLIGMNKPFYIINLDAMNFCRFIPFVFNGVEFVLEYDFLYQI
jgi:hypothetical protein